MTREEFLELKRHGELFILTGRLGKLNAIADQFIRVKGEPSGDTYRRDVDWDEITIAVGMAVQEMEGHDRLRSLEEGDRQMTVLALAELGLSRPGFSHAARLIAMQLAAGEIYDAFQRTNADRVKYTHAPVGNLGPDLRDRLRRALDVLDLARGSLGIDQSVTVQAIDRCLEENKALFCEGMMP